MRQILASYIDSKTFIILESVLSLTRRYNRAVIFTIHQRAATLSLSFTVLVCAYGPGGGCTCLVEDLGLSWGLLA